MGAPPFSYDLSWFAIANNGDVPVTSSYHSVHQRHPEAKAHRKPNTSGCLSTLFTSFFSPNVEIFFGGCCDQSNILRCNSLRVSELVWTLWTIVLSKAVLQIVIFTTVRNEHINFSFLTFAPPGFWSASRIKHDSAPCRELDPPEPLDPESPHVSYLEKSVKFNMFTDLGDDGDVDFVSGHVPCDYQMMNLRINELI